MALEDFFTLSEIKDGLGTIARVEELIAVMEKQEDCSVNNLDAARQWCTVAKILTATEENCLIHFLRLNGLCYLNGWLQDALNINNDTNDCFAEKLLDLLLGALEKLPVTQDNLNSSGIAVTLERIQGLENSNAQNRAREMIAKWEMLNRVLKENLACHDNMIENEKTMETGNARQTDSMTDSDAPSSKGRVDEVDCCAKLVEVGPFDMDSSSTSCTPDVVKDTQVALDNQQKLKHSSSSERNAGQEDVDTVSSSAVLPDKKATQQSSIYSAIKAPDSGIICSTISVEREVDDWPEHPQKELPSCVPEDMELDKHCDDLSKTNDNVSCADLSTAAAKHVEKPLMRDQEMCLDTEEDISDTERTGKTNESKVLRSSAVKSESSEIDIHQKESRGNAEATKEADISFLQTGKRVDSKIHRGFSRSIGGHASVHRNTEEVTLGYGDDALDFAVQVAIEAQREVADREQLSSSLEGKSEGEILDSGSSKLDDKSEQSDLSKSSKLHDSDGESSMSKKSSRTTEKIDDSKDTGQKIDTPKSSSGVLEPKGDKDKSGCGFDLNDDAFADEPIPTYGITSNLSAPRAVIATSKGPSFIPIAPLHFEGELGWRGSAATSAFRPASPRRTPDSEKNVSNSKRTSNLLDFDLNVAEVDEDAGVDHVLEKPIPDSSDLPSRDSSIEVSSRRTEKLKLDLNSLGDEDPYAYQSHWTHHQNGNASASSASFSSARQQTMRDIDLNDNPSFVDQCGPQNPSRSCRDPSTFEAHKMDDAGFNIMGSRMSVELDRKEPANQTQSFLPNGIIMGSTSGRPPMFYTPMPGPAYSYNNLTVSPNMPLPPAIYGAGSIPYMVDSRTVIPQVLGPPSGLNGVPQSRPPFFVSLAQGFPAVGAPRPNLDLNSGMICLDGNGNRDIGGFRPMCMPGYSGLSEEQTRASSQPGSGSVIGLKRKEPTDLVWDPYPDHKKVTWK